MLAIIAEVVYFHVNYKMWSTVNVTDWTILLTTVSKIHYELSTNYQSIEINC